MLIAFLKTAEQKKKQKKQKKEADLVKKDHRS